MEKKSCCPQSYAAKKKISFLARSGAAVCGSVCEEVCTEVDPMRWESVHYIYSVSQQGWGASVLFS